MQTCTKKRNLDVVLNIKKGEKLIQSKKYNKAEAIFRNIIEVAPRNHSALFNLGLICFEKREYERALKYFRNCIELDDTDYEAYFYLGKICIKMGLLNEGEEFLNESFKLNRNYDKCLYYMCKHYIENNDTEKLSKLTPFILNSENIRILNTVGKFYLRNGNSEKAMKLLRKSSLLNENQSELEEILSQNTERLKITFFGRYDTFLKELIENLKAFYDVEICKNSSEKVVKDVLQATDIAWFEWCDDLTVRFSRIRADCIKIVRLHSYELFTNFPDIVKWNNIDLLIFVSDTVREIFKDRFPGVQVKMKVIPNAVNFSKFNFDFKKKKGNKICYVGHLNYKKNPALLLECFKVISDYNPDYQFYIAGTHQDYRFKIYMDDMIKKMNLNINFDGWIENVDNWLKDKDYIISTSVFESFQYSVAEGIASGVLPLVHWWQGAEKIYPNEALFVTSNDCLSVLKKYEKTDRKKLVKKYRESLLEKHSISLIMDEIRKTIETL